jgi:hypothetical protein
LTAKTLERIWDLTWLFAKITKISHSNKGSLVQQKQKVRPQSDFLRSYASVHLGVFASSKPDSSDLLLLPWIALPGVCLSSRVTQIHTFVAARYDVTVVIIVSVCPTLE